MNNKNGKNLKGINDFLWAVQAHLDAVKSGRIRMFGNGRNSSFKFEKENIEISADEIKNLTNTNTNESDHEGE